jgi:hypothetical protein
MANHTFVQLVEKYSQQLEPPTSDILTNKITRYDGIDSVE